MVKIEQNYKDHEKWKHGAWQEVLVEPGEGVVDVIRYVQKHLDYFGYHHLTFNPAAIVNAGDRYYVTFIDRTKGRLYFGSAVRD